MQGNLLARRSEVGVHHVIPGEVGWCRGRHCDCWPGALSDWRSADLVRGAGSIADGGVTRGRSSPTSIPVTSPRSTSARTSPSRRSSPTPERRRLRSPPTLPRPTWPTPCPRRSHPSTSPPAPPGDPSKGEYPGPAGSPSPRQRPCLRCQWRRFEQRHGVRHRDEHGKSRDAVGLGVTGRRHRTLRPMYLCELQRRHADRRSLEGPGADPGECRSSALPITPGWDRRLRHERRGEHRHPRIDLLGHAGTVILMETLGGHRHRADGATAT